MSQPIPRRSVHSPYGRTRWLAVARRRAARSPIGFHRKTRPFLADT